MKKYSWIVALLIALALAFIACPAPEEEEEEEEEGALEWVVVFDMKDAANGIVPHGIQELPVGALSFPQGVNPLAPIVRAAEDQHASYEIIEADGKKALKYVTHATWGPGFDLPNAVFGFFGGNDEHPGDKIVITGKAEGAPIDLAFNKNQGGAQQIVGNQVTAEGNFTVEVVLTAADVTAIKGNEQAVLRFEDRAGETTVTIYNIVIEGARPTDVVKLETPVITLTGSTITWTAIEGAGSYKVFALKAGATEATTVATLGSTAVSYDLANSALPPTKYTETAVTYSITLIALGVAGVSTDSDPSEAKEYVKQPPAPPPLLKIKIGGVEKDAELYTIAGTFEKITTGGKDVGYTFTRGGAYEASYAYLKVDLGAAKLSDFSQVKFTYAGVSGDIGYKDIQLRASATEPSGSIAAPIVNKPRYDTYATYQSGTATGVLSFGTGFQANNDESDGPITLKIEPTLVNTLTGEIYIAIYFGASATGSFGGAASPTVHKISDIELIAKTATAITHEVYFTTVKTNGIILATQSVADNATIASVVLPQADPAKYSDYYTAFMTGGTTITGWKNKADDSDFVFGTTQVTKDTVLYAVATGAPPPFDLDALKALSGGITLSGGGTTAPTFDATTKVLTVTGSSSTIFYFTFADASITPDPTSGNAKITYACVVETGQAKAITKNDANSWTDTSPQAYPTFTASTTAVQTNTLSVAISSLAASATGITFQHNVDGNANAKYYLKIISVEIIE